MSLSEELKVPNFCNLMAFMMPSIIKHFNLQNIFCIFINCYLHSTFINCCI